MAQMKTFTVRVNNAESVLALEHAQELAHRLARLMPWCHSLRNIAQLLDQAVAGLVAEEA